MFHTHQKGHIAQKIVELEALKRGFIVSIPSEQSRYDIIIDDGEKLSRVQVKYCDYIKGTAYCLDLTKSSFNCKGHKERKIYTRKEIDAVLVYFPDEKYLCWFGPEEFDGKQCITVRLDAPKNGQKKGIRPVDSG